ncbi:MAG: proline racemase family protein [Phycisphaerae bacterium]|nr:proline racemase family protein [Phycisphaerae bacterium]
MNSPRAQPQPYCVVDSHTEGEPTRVFLDDRAPFAGRTVADLLGAWRTPEGGWSVPQELLTLVAEPRAAVATVGAILCKPTRPDHVAGVVFFNCAGPLGMCGHGTIGLAATLRHLRRIEVGEHRFETPVGSVTARVREDGRIEVDNVEAYRHRAGVEVEVNHRVVRGDIAWGGNWFYIVDEDRDLDLARVDQQLAHGVAIRNALERDRIRGANGAVIDHIALFGRPVSRDADSRNFVLCPNGSFDRSPCGTGTSAKLACLASDRSLLPGQVWRQESVIGSRFDAWFRTEPGRGDAIYPTIRGRAWIVAETSLLLDPDDPARASGWAELAEA